jgi:hypothetical protein
MAAADRRRNRGTNAWLGVPAFVAVALVACGGGDGDGETSSPQFVGVPETVAIGGMPGPLSDAIAPTMPDITSDVTTTTEPEPGADRDPITGPLVDEVLDHRLLLIGDTVLAATTPRAGGIMCDVVAGFGWDVAIEAEPGRPIEFAVDVLDERPTGDWDVVGLMFGHHVPGTIDEFERSLDTVLDRLGPRPVILYTVTETSAEQVDVNRVLRERVRSRPNVVLVDWAEATALEPDVVLDDGGPSPSDEGAGRLALFTAALLGRTPSGEVGSCVEPLFTDDSAIVL